MGLRHSRFRPNENPYPPLPQVVKVIEQAAHHVNRYPDPGSAELIDATLRTRECHVNTSPSRRALLHFVTNSRSRLRAPATRLCSPGARSRPIRLSRRWQVPNPLPFRCWPMGVTTLAALAAAVTDRTRLVFICSPNNPTGTVVTLGRVRRVHGGSSQRRDGCPR